MRQDVEFKWNSKRDEAFKKSKNIITSENVFVCYDISLSLKIYCDEWQVGIGAVLLQISQEKLISFVSRLLSNREKNILLFIEKYWLYTGE